MIPVAKKEGPQRAGEHKKVVILQARKQKTAGLEALSVHAKHTVLKLTRELNSVLPN